MLARVVCVSLALATPTLAAPPAGVVELQEHVRKIIEAAEPSVVALVISHNPEYKAQSAADRLAGVLGSYDPIQPPRIVARQARDRLDLSDAKNAPDNSYGTGIVIDAGGLILTNYHLIEGARKVYVRWPGGVGSYANIHAADARSDLAVLKLINAPSRLAPMRVADVRTSDDTRGRKATVYRGQWVVTLAHPFAAGFADGTPSASWGMLSNVRRAATGFTSEDPVANHLYQFGNLLQTDARLNLGCSGGALLNLDGELVGLTTSTAAVTGSEASGGYAIPMTASYRRIVAALRAGHEVEYGFLGVLPGGMTSINGVQGLHVANVTGGMPASKAGLHNNDVILAINDNPVREIDDLFLNVGAALAGTEIKLKVATPGGGSRDVSTKLMKSRHTYASLASNRPAAVHGLRVEYSSVLLQQNIVGRFNNGFVHTGVVVREVEPRSAAETKFKLLGTEPREWMITQVNGTDVETPEEFYKAANDNRGSVRLRVVNPMDANDRGRELNLP